MKTERPVSRKTKMPVTLCSLDQDQKEVINNEMLSVLGKVQNR